MNSKFLIETASVGAVLLGLIFVGFELKQNTEAVESQTSQGLLEMAYQIAETYAYRNEVNPAFSWLEQAFENRDGGLTEILVDPLFVNIHDDPRWDVFLDKMGLLQ